MYDAGKVLVGIMVFLALMTSPFWLNAGGESPKPPKLQLPDKTKAEKCIEPVAYMRANHMQMLNDFRHRVVRQDERTFENSEGKVFNMSLSTRDDSCIGCHETKKKFCDRCHTYASASPYCWECHIAPEEKE